MPKHKFSFELPEGDGPKTRPVEQPARGHHSHADAMADKGPADGAAPLMAPRAGAHRGKASGRYLPKDQVEMREVVSGCHLVVRDPRLVMSDQSRPYGRPGNDWSSTVSIAEFHHRSICAGGPKCQVPTFHQGVTD